MKNLFILLCVIWVAKVQAQNYPNILNYNYNGTPNYGVKIKTNLPFTPANQMPTINIVGYNCGSHEPINLSICYYTYSDAADWSNAENYYFYFPSMSSSGAYTPKVFLSAENGKVVIFIDEKAYFQRFTVSAFAQGKGEMPSWFENWTAADEPLNGVKTVEIPYINRFKGDVFLSNNGVWAGNGNVGIGTITPQEKLSVNGNTRAREIKVETANWLDFVFEENYKITSLSDLEKYIKLNKHLPDMPSAKEVENEGLTVGDLLKKQQKMIEELTLHLIEKDKALKDQNEVIKDFEKRLLELENRKNNK